MHDQFIAKLYRLYDDMGKEPNLPLTESRAAKHLDGVYTEIYMRLGVILSQYESYRSVHN